MKESWYFTLCVMLPICGVFIKQNVFAKNTSTHAAVVREDTVLSIFVSTDGKDSNPGTLSEPFLTISKAVSIAQAGDTIFVRGGEYTYTGSSTAITLPDKTGSSIANRCNIIGYNGERPLLNFSAMTGTSADGIKINGSFWYLRGLDFKGAPHNGLKISGGNYNIIELCSSYENRNTGIQLAAGASCNRFINCDSYNNRDAGDGNADGFSPKLDVGTGNYFYGCRAWQNSDDGWDGYLRPSDDVTDTLENCWTFMNGYYKDGVTVGTGNGNGFKTGGCDTVPGTGGLRFLRHNMVLINCLSFYNKAKGFDQNHNRGSVTMLNCSAFNNGNGSTKAGDQYNYAFPETLLTDSGKVLTIKNSLSLGSTYGIQVCPNPTPVVLVTNSWPISSPYASVATSDDFVSVDTSGVRGPRKADGNLPDVIFMHLVQGSQFINTGTNVGLTFYGTAPDLGCFESNYPTGIINENDVRIADFQLLQNYPNPFNPTTIISFSVGKYGPISLKVYDILGREITTLMNEMKTSGTYSVRWDGRNSAGQTVSGGVYFYQLKGPPGFTKTQKMMLLN